jgi:hypothetical protein
MPVWLVDNQYCWADVYAEHAPFEADGPDGSARSGSLFPRSAAPCRSRALGFLRHHKVAEQVKWPDWTPLDGEGDAMLQTQRYDPDRAHVFHVTEGIFERLHELMPVDETFLAMYREAGGRPHLL